MFNTNKTVLYFVLGKVFCQYFFNKKIETFSLDWNTENLKEVFVKIKAKIKADQIRVVLGNDLSYVLALKLTKTETNPQNVANELKKFILGDLNEKNFRYELKGQDENGKNIVQVFAVAHDFLTILSDKAKEAGLKIEFIVPASIILSSALKSSKKILLFWEGQEKIVLVSNNQVVYVTENVTLEPKELTKEIVSIVKENFNFEPEVYMANWPEKLVLGTIPTSEIKIDIFSAIAKNGKGSLYLGPIASNVKPVIETVVKTAEPLVEKTSELVKPLETSKAVETASKPNKKTSTSMTILVSLIILIIGLGIWAYFLYASQSNDTLIEKNNIQINDVPTGIKSVPNPGPTKANVPAVVVPKTIDAKNNQTTQDINTIESGVNPGSVIPPSANQ